MHIDNTISIIESILFLSGEKVQISDLASIIGVDPISIKIALKEYECLLSNTSRGIKIMSYDDSVQLTTVENNYKFLQKFIEPKRKSILTKAAIETITIIAYKQPITRAQIESIRGVKCEKAILTLMEKGLIEEAGRLEGTGRPILYKTTKDFLSHFSLSSVDSLPNYDLVQERIKNNEFND